MAASVASTVIVGVFAAPALGVAAAPDSTVVKVRSLPMRHRAPDVPWLAGRVLHKADGGATRLPWGKSAALQHSLRLIGRTPRGWLVKGFSGDTWTVWLVSRGKRTLLSTHSVSEGDVVGFRLAEDGQHYAARAYTDGEDGQFVGIFDLTGHRLASRLFDSDGKVLDLSGSQAVIGTTDTVIWDYEDGPDGTVTDLGVNAAGADLGHDLLFVTDPGTGESGPTSLSMPATPSWTAAMVDPRVSPDGTNVLARTQSRGPDLVVRAVATGLVRHTFQVRWMAYPTPVWGTPRAFVLIGANGAASRERVVRCRLNGRCAAPSALVPEGRLSIPAT
ncbi:MAG: hypothetical protein QM714_06160 [Nocardioides sp.]|uniref:hypothetical protein n=1 Tax=Nocardioides sp. TaxID=35761 RepID=UPI0039E2FB8A